MLLDKLHNGSPEPDVVERVGSEPQVLVRCPISHHLVRELGNETSQLINADRQIMLFIYHSFDAGGTTAPDQKV